MNKLKFDATAEMLDLRLDKAISLHPEIKNRSRATYLLDAGSVLVNGKVAKPSSKLQLGDSIEITFPDMQSNKITAYDFPLDILFEDEDIIVVNKPPGLVVHPAAGHAQDTLVNALLMHTKNLSMKFGEERPGIVHRIDKDTSGLLVIAKNDEAHENLMLQFKEHTTHRVYYAVALGHARNLSGTYQSWLARHPVDRKRYSSLVDKEKKIIRDPEAEVEIGKWAVTHYETLARKSGLSYLKLRLETGRTHQIRVHLAEDGLSIAGDHIYGSDKKIGKAEAKKTKEDLRDLKRFLLHAGELGFTHPRTGKRLNFKVDWPTEDLKLIKSWGLL